MFGLGMGEIVIIAIVALLFLGPDKLPTAAKAIGKTIRGFRAQTRELTDSLEKDNELGDAVRELRSALQDDPLRPPVRKPPPRDDPEDSTAASPDKEVAPADKEAATAGGHGLNDGRGDWYGDGGGDGHAHLDGHGAEPAASGDDPLDSDARRSAEINHGEPAQHVAAAGDDDSVQLAEPLSAEPDMPTIRPASGSVARMYEGVGELESSGDEATQPPKPVGKGNG